MRAAVHARGTPAASTCRLHRYLCAAAQAAPAAARRSVPLQDFAAGATIWAMSGLHFRLRRVLMALRRITCFPLRTLLTVPVRAVCRMLSVKLSDRMLVALEVAIELWLALTFSIEARIVAADASAGEHDRAVRDVLRQELEDQKAEVWDFILDRCGPRAPHTPAPCVRRCTDRRAAAAALADTNRWQLQCILPDVPAGHRQGRRADRP